MSINTPPLAAPSVETPPQTPLSSKPSSGKVAVAALVLGIVAFVCAIIPGLSFVAFLPAFAALVFGIVALATGAPGRGKAITGVILGPIAVLVAIIVSVTAIASGIGSSVDVAKPVGDPSTAESTEPITEPVEAEPTEKSGSRENPAAAGSVIEITDNSGPVWQVQIGAANLNAGDVIAAENQFNAAADAGSQYVLVPVTYTYVGSTSGTPWIDIDIEFVSAGGTTHTQEFIVIPTSITDINEMYSGATATGNIVVMAPTADVDKGSWAISTPFGSPYFVKIV
ncbi:DUF4190 domain-containing protein [Salinibacterium sp.]|uniref:DUF4190 domain-containing protein n=1 Tax=Salinibacterium sp. TaxID=1915057 RepID=UPI00286B1DC0|nr:DUF4190 domain-containing protein [Salinibacterium sp.]